MAKPAPARRHEVPFGVNEIRLSARQWLCAGLILVTVLVLTPWAWEKIERFVTGPDYRIPYQLSKDYWLYQRRLSQLAGSDKVVLLGDSVVWGEYVNSDGTLSHFLNREVGAPDRFINGGVNGLFPLAEEGLVNYYGKALQHRRILLHCNVLWMTSPKADLSTAKEERFNHSDLVPQFSPRIPCYKADANARLSAVIERQVGFIAWVGHLQSAYFGDKSILSWTLEEDNSTPPQYPNSYKNPLAQIRLEVPRAPAEDPQRGPLSPRHKPWSDGAAGTTRFEWVSLDDSLQWRAFQRVVATLRQRGNDVMVVLGPFNEHIMADEDRPEYRRIRDGVAAWLNEQQIPSIVPETLPSSLYADASHPLTQGYELLARNLLQDPAFRKWLSGPESINGSR